MTAAMLVALLWAGAALAERAERLEVLLDALRLDQTVRIMRAEGLVYGAGLARDMMPDADMDSWMGRVDRIYDIDKMRALVAARLEKELAGVPLGPINAFFGSEIGEEIVTLELATREAFLDPAAEQAARARYAGIKGEKARIARQIETLIADSDLVERNVTGILNANLMLYRGLADGGAYELTEEDMLLDAWSQQDEIRADSAQWLGAYLLTAYRPLSGDAVDQYISFWRTAEGRALNRALFAAFDRMYGEISYLLGRAMAQHMRSQEL